jgi:dihydrodipicolinate synthase/N-acetylneuraminate lyase
MERKRKKYSGVIVPMITPFTASGGIDEESVERVMGNFVANEIQPLVLGTTGETASIHEEDKIKFINILTSRYLDVCKIYAVVSENCFRKSIELTKQYYDMGIELVVALLPSYYTLNDYQIKKYFEEFADMIPGKMFIYNIPATTHMSIPLEIIDELSRHEKIVGVKDSERDRERLNRSIELWKNREDFSHFIGWGEQCFNGLWEGSDGIVPSTGNFAPHIYRDMYRAVLSKEEEKGETCQNISMEISAIYQKGRLLSESLAALKVMMNVAGLCNTSVLPPLTELLDDEAKLIRNKTESIIKKYQLSWIK